MAKLSKLKRLFLSRYLTLGLRLSLGLVFLLAGFAKLTHSGDFVDVVIERDILPAFWARFYASVLPWAEILTGFLLIFGLFRRFASVMSITMILSFVIANGFTIYKGVNAECGCFGDVWIVDGRNALIVDVLMLLASFQILFQKLDFLSIDSWKPGSNKVAKN